MIGFYRLLTKKPHYDTVLRNKSVTVGEEMRNKVTLACTSCGSRNYTTMKTSSNDRLEINKFCKVCNSHTNHRETK